MFSWFPFAESFTWSKQLSDFTRKELFRGTLLLAFSAAGLMLKGSICQALLERITIWNRSKRGR